MKTVMKSLLVATALVGALAVSPAMASTTLLTSTPANGTTTTFTTTGNQGFDNAGPVTINGFVATGNPQVTYGNEGYGINANGVWSNFSWVATNDPDGSITFDLGQNYSSAGGFLNYAPGTGTDPFIRALAADQTVIGTYDILTLAPIVTPFATNAGAFRGISSTNNDIRYLTFGGSYILTHSLTVANVAAVPEPATWAMMLVGFGMMGATMRYRRRSTTAVYA